MKKNLRNALILALGLVTTGVFAQDWDGDSRTRINMSGENSQFSTDQRATLGVNWGDSDWGIRVSMEANYTMGYDWDSGDRNSVNMDVYEAYASANLFGFANMTIGRQALEYGSGEIIGKNDWSTVFDGNRHTHDAAVFSIDNDLLNLDLGIATQTKDEELETSRNMMSANLGKRGDNWGMNLLYVTTSATLLGGDAIESTAMGLDIDYTMGNFEMGVSYNTGSNNVDDKDQDMMKLSVGYSVNDNLSLSGSRTSYGEHGFNPTVGNTGGYTVGALDTLGNYWSASAGSWDSHGNMGHLAPEDVAMTLGVNYDMGEFSIGGSYTTISSGADDPGILRDGETWDEWERQVMDFSLGYNLNDNASMSLRYVTDGIADQDAEKYMWLGLQITP